MSATGKYWVLRVDVVRPVDTRREGRVEAGCPGPTPMRDDRDTIWWPPPRLTTFPKSEQGARSLGDPRDPDQVRPLTYPIMLGDPCWTGRRPAGPPVHVSGQVMVAFHVDDRLVAISRQMIATQTPPT